MNVRQSPEPDHQGQAAESPDQDQDQAEVQLARTTLSNDPPPSTSKGAKKKSKMSASSGFLASIETNSGKATREKSGWETVRTFTSEEEFQASTLAKELR